MLLLIVTTIILIIAIVVRIYSVIPYVYRSTKEEIIVTINTTIIVLSGALVIVFLILIPMCKAQNAEMYTELTIKKATITYLLEEKGMNIYEDNIYREVIAYNQEVKTHKESINSAWIGIYSDKRIASLDYIKLKEGVEDGT